MLWVVVRWRLWVRPVVGGAADEALLARVVVVVAAREAEDARVGRARPVDGGRAADHVLMDLRQTQRVQLQRVHQVLLITKRGENLVLGCVGQAGLF